MRFIQYLFDVKSDCKADTLIPALRDACVNNGQYAVGNVKMFENSLQFQANNENWWYENSLLPRVNIMLLEAGDTKRLSVEFRQKKAMEMFCRIYLLILSILELVALGAFFSGNLGEPVVMGLLAFLIIEALVLSYLWIRIAAQKFRVIILKVLEDAKALED